MYSRCIRTYLTLGNSKKKIGSITQEKTGKCAMELTWWNSHARVSTTFTVEWTSRVCIGLYDILYTKGMYDILYTVYQGYHRGQLHWHSCANSHRGHSARHALLFSPTNHFKRASLDYGNGGNSEARAPQ